MKINFKHLIVSSLSVCLLTNFDAIANNQNPVTEEIIGSGIFDVNKTRTFLINEDTTLYFDQVEIDLEFFEIIGSGFKSEFTVNPDATSSVDSGTINAIELITNIKGPVTSINPLMVLEQPVLLTSDTERASLGELKLGQNIAVSGYLNANNSLKASKVLLNESDWKVRGYPSNINNNSFNIGSLDINRSSEQFIDCESGFNNGILIEVIMTEDTNYQSGTAIETLQSIRCLKRNRLADEKVILPSVIQGFINDMQGQDFWIDDIKVNTDNTTEYINGEKNFIDLAVNVEVQGIFDSETSEIQAEFIRFTDNRIEITFPVQPEEVNIGESINLLNTIFHVTPQTRDNANILVSGIQQPIQIGLQGYIDSQGNAYISKILDKGLPDYQTVSLRGNILSMNNPELNLLNNTVDVSNSTIIKLGVGIIDVETFFSEVTVGSQIDIKNARYDINSNKFVDGLVTIRDPNNSQNVTEEIIGSGIFGAFVTATITATADQIFVSSFE